ncbi:hypothetical protein DH2020_015359 [Rehmannia glutinosa]|uniref:Uncharacterized protein n=1 Tax=Rehmannia glutinosa TaxID=99300 RepID=A0ABR0WSI8_REHGL
MGLLGFVMKLHSRFGASRRFFSSIYTRSGPSNASLHPLTEQTIMGNPEGLNYFKKYGSSKRYYSSSTRSTSSTRPSLPLHEQTVTPTSWRSFLIPGSVLAGISGLVLFIHYNDEKRAVLKGKGEKFERSAILGPIIGGPFSLIDTEEFDSRIVGLTGPHAAIRQMAQEYRVFFRKVDEEGDDYLVESSHHMYLINPNMEVERSFGVEYSAEELAEAITKEMTKTKITVPQN